jgi:hypothetical protein
MLSNTDPMARWHQISLGPGGIDRLDCTMDSFIIENRSFFLRISTKSLRFCRFSENGQIEFEIQKNEKF